MILGIRPPAERRSRHPIRTQPNAGSLAACCADDLRSAGVEPDHRVAEAIELVEKNPGADGCWTLQNRHGDVLDFDMEAADEPSRWNTLRALRVLNWAGRDG